MRERDQSLAAQMDLLSKKQAIRDRRRMEQRMRSAAEREDGDGRAPSFGHQLASDGRAPSNATGGLATGRTAAEAVAEAARLSESVKVYRCDVCQVTFKVEAQYHMHMAGAAHRKAVAKLEEDRMRAMRGGAAAEAAMAAAGWNGRQGDAGSHDPAWVSSARGQHQFSQGRGHQQQANRGHRAPQDPQRPVRTHADVVKELENQREKGPLDLDGWVPPSVEAPFEYAQPEPVPRVAAAAMLKQEVKEEKLKHEDVKNEEAEEAVGPVRIKVEDIKDEETAVKQEQGAMSDEAGDEDGDNPLAGILGVYGEADDDDSGSGSSSGSSDDDENVVAPEGTSFF